MSHTDDEERQVAKKLEEEFLRASEEGQVQLLTVSPSGYPFKDNDGMLVLGPDVLVGPDDGVITWRGEHYHRLTVKPMAPAEESQADRRVWMRRDAMQWAVELHKAILTSGGESRTRVTETAQTIYDWMIQD